MCGAFPTKRPRISGSETHVTSAVSNNAALDSNDALDSAVNRVEGGAATRLLWRNGDLVRCGLAERDRPSSRSPQVQRSDAELRCGRGLHRSEAEDQQLGARSRRRVLDRCPDKDRAVRVGAVSEIAAHATEELPGLRRHAFKIRRVAAQLHRRSLERLTRGHSQNDFKARAEPDLLRSFPKQLHWPHLARLPRCLLPTTWRRRRTRATCA